MTAEIPSGAETDGRVLVSFVCDGLSDGALMVMRLSVREAVSRLHTIDVSLEGFTEPIDGGSLLGRGARIVCTRPDGSPLRSFLGIVTEAAAEVTVVAKRFRLHLVLRSPLFALELSTDRAVFTEVSATDVIKTLFGRVGILSSSIVLRCDPPARVRRSITLVGDSLLASVERLLEEEGLVCFCVHAADGPRFVIGAGSAVWETAAVPSFVFNPRGASLFAFDGVVAESSLAASSVRLLDHDPEKPVLSLTAEAQVTEVPDAVVEEWPGGHATPGAGSRVAKARLAGLRGGTKTIKATGSAPHLAAGHAFSVEGTPHDLDGDYIALEVRHAFELGDTFRTQVRAIARTASFAPQRRAPRARTAGPTTAWVAGPSGAIVHTDDHGRTKLRFPWDRGAKDDGTSSAFARVLSPMMLSSQVVPRVGWGVLVDFENGDPDRPVVVGRLFDGHHPPPHPLPAARTTSTWLTPDTDKGRDFHEIRFVDAKDAELLHLHAAKDYVLDVGKDRTETVAAAESWQVGASRTVTIEENETRTREMSLQLTIGGALSRTVEKDWETTVKGDYRKTGVGDRTVTIDEDVSLVTSGTDSATTTGDVTMELGSLAETSARFDLAVGKTSDVEVDGDIDEHADGGIMESVGADYTVKVGSSSVAVDGNATIAAKGAMKLITKAALTVNAGAALELSSQDALTLRGAVITLQGATSFTVQVGDNKLTVGKGGVSISASKIKIEGSGPVILGTGLVASK